MAPGLPLALLLLLAGAPASAPALDDGPSIEVTGTVVDADGRPVAGAVIFVDGRATSGMDLRRWRPWRDGGDLRGRTSADGRFRILIRPGRVRVMAGLGGGGLRARAVAVDTERPDTLTGLRLAFGGAAELAGRVLDPEGRPVAGVSVRAFPEPVEAAPDGGASFGVAPTDGDGRFRLPDLRPGAYRLYAEGEGWWCRACSTDGLPVRTGIAGLAVPVVRMTSIHGKVTVPGGPRGARVPPRRFVVETKPSGGWVFETEDGSFEVPIYMPWMKLGVFVRSEGQGTLAFAVDLAAGERKDLGEIRLGPPVTVVGRVTDERGVPVKDAKVMLGYAGYAMKSDVLTDAAGRFALPGVAAADAPLRIEHPGHRRTEAIAGKGQRDLEIRLGGGNGLEVLVEEADGRPLDGALVRVASERGGRCVSAGGGRCTISGLAPGHHPLRLTELPGKSVSRPDGPDLHVDLVEGAPMAPIRFRAPRRASSLKVHVAAADGTYAHAWVYVVPGEAGPGGLLGGGRRPAAPYYRGGDALTHEIANLPPDRYTVIAAAVSPAITCGFKVIDLAEGEDRTIVIKVPASSSDCRPSP